MNQFPEVVARMDALLEKRFRDVMSSPRSLKMPDFMISDRRSDIHPFAPVALSGNAINEGKYLFGLKALNDGATYKIDVRKTGTYGVYIHALPSKRKTPLVKSAVLRVSVGKRAVQNTVKSQGKTKLGVLKLSAGKQTCQITVIKTAGDGKPVFSKGIKLIQFKYQPSQ